MHTFNCRFTIGDIVFRKGSQQPFRITEIKFVVIIDKLYVKYTVSRDDDSYSSEMNEAELCTLQETVRHTLETLSAAKIIARFPRHKVTIPMDDVSG